MLLPKIIEALILKLENSGFEAYAVGGCVRDSLLNTVPKDYDITTSALPEQIKLALSEFNIIDTGIKHGTVTVVLKDEFVEITTFRIDGEYKDNRHPDNISFALKLNDDLSRRDFTVNALAFSHKTGIIDIFGGKKDLENKIIRAVGIAENRFEEDALRILRALRFAAVYSFSIEEETARAIHDKKQLLRNISGERIASELNKLICADCANILRDYSDVFAVIIPEISDCKGFLQHSKYHDRDVLEHIISSISAVEPVLHLRLTMLFHDLGKPSCFCVEKGVGHFKGHAAVSTNIAERILTKLHYGNDIKETVLVLVKRHDMPIINDKRLIKRWLCQYGERAFFDLVKVHIADDTAKATEYHNRITEYHDIEKTALGVLSENECFSLKMLEINGKDLLKLGYEGKEIGETLNFLLNAVIDEKCTNNHTDLKKYLEDKRK